MTDHDEARLAEEDIVAAAKEAVRCADMPNSMRMQIELAGAMVKLPGKIRLCRILLRLLDAAARPHDASFVTRPFHDACVNELMEQRDDAQARSGTYMGHECCVCGFPIHGVMIGMGDGTGQRFGHRDCYERERAEAAELKVAMLEKALAERGGRRVAELERDVDGYKQTVSLQYERGDRLAAALAASEAKLCVVSETLTNLCDAWNGHPDGGIHKGNITNAYKAARAALRPAEEKPPDGPQFEALLTDHLESCHTQRGEDKCTCPYGRQVAEGMPR